MTAGGGAYRRRIQLTAPDARVTVAELEDDFHHFRVTVRHDGSHVTSVEGEAVRHPWTECAGAVVPLRALVGMPLTAAATGVREHADPRQNCTHLFDIAGLAVAHAAAGRERRRYDVVIPDRVGGRTTATLSRDDGPALAWELEGSTITSPPPYAGIALRGAFMAWAGANLDPETAESAIVLRRACDISLGRTVDLDLVDRATELGEIMLGTCHAFQPRTIEVALRKKGTTRTFTTQDDLLR